jgi:hypothetical protein
MTKTSTRKPLPERTAKWVPVTQVSGIDGEGKSSGTINLQGGEVRLRYIFRGKKSPAAGSAYLVEKGSDPTTPDVMVTGTCRGEVALGRRPRGKYYVEVSAESVRYCVILEELRW